MNDKVMPAYINDSETGERYELDFSRASVQFAEKREFDIDTVAQFPSVKIPELFFYAFRKNHPRVSRDKTDAMLERMGGLSSKSLERLMSLYNQARFANIFSGDDESDEERKNASVTMEL